MQVYIVDSVVGRVEEGGCQDVNGRVISQPRSFVMAPRERHLSSTCPTAQLAARRRRARACATSNCELSACGIHNPSLFYIAFGGTSTGVMQFSTFRLGPAPHHPGGPCVPSSTVSPHPCAAEKSERAIRNALG